MTLREFLEYAIQPVCVIDDVEQGNMYIQIDHYNTGSEFWLTEKALNLKIKTVLSHEKYPDCICVILEDDEND